MKKINNLDELEKLIGRDSVEKCFVEYMMLMIAKARKWDALQGGDVPYQPERSECGDGEMMADGDLTDEEIKQLEKRISDIKARNSR